MRPLQRNVIGIVFIATVASLAFGQTAPSQLSSEPRSAAVEQIAPAPNHINRAATPADKASVAPRPAARELGKVNQLPPGARASTGASEITLTETTRNARSDCPEEIGNVAAHLPAEAAGAVGACATLSWLESERARREREAATDTAAALAAEEAAAGRKQPRPSPPVSN